VTAIYEALDWYDCDGWGDRTATAPGATRGSIGLAMAGLAIAALSARARRRSCQRNL
jgi:hypothetical protein